MRRRLRLRDEAGVTLIEMIMVLAILGTVLGGVTTVFISGSRAEVQVNNRFQAQEASRLAMASIRKDVHSACAAALVNTASPYKSQVTLAVPITASGVLPDPTTQCAGTNSNMTKIIWCVVPSPTVSTKFAIYRSTTSTCTTSSKLVADNLVNNLPGYVAFFQTVNATTSIALGEVQTLDVDIPVNLKQGTSGVPFDLKERLALTNTAWSATTATACSATATCTNGPCTAVGACFVPLFA